MKNKINKQAVKFIIFFICAAVLVLLDQYTKYLAVINLKESPSIPVIKNILELSYLENRGAAFGILQGQFVIFFIITAIVGIIILYILYKLKLNKRYLPLFICIILIFSGAVGNLIDRYVNNFVVDFIYFKLIDFPIFNLADIYVSVATALLLILSIFFYKDEDFNFISINKK